MTHLRRYLEQTGAIAPEQLDSALRRQQIYGGSLDTVLLELEICDPQTLGELLTQACGLPVVPVELIDNGLDRPWDAIPEELLEIGWAVPLSDAGDELMVGVHPDLPDERLGALYRTVPRVKPMVTPECCLEKIAAERTSSVVPQRYAVLCASYVSALRRRPSVSDVGFPILPEHSEETRRARTPQPARPGRARATDDTVPGAHAPTGVPRHVDPQQASALSAGPPITPGAPPVRYTPSGTMISTREKIEAAFDEADVERRMAGALAALKGARTRDAAIDGLVSAAMVISPRVGLFRVREDELVGLSTPRTGMPDLNHRVVGTPEGSAAHTAVESGTFSGDATDEDLMLALGLEDRFPCILTRIGVAGRAVMVLYIDHGGREFLPAEAHLVEELCGIASDAFEGVLRLRRAADQPVLAPPPETRVKAPIVGPPPDFGTATPPRWGPAPPRVQAAYADGGGPAQRPAMTTARFGDDNKADAGPAPRRLTQLDGSPAGGIRVDDVEDTDDVDLEERARLLTINAMPPPPPIPPPPPMSGPAAPGEPPRSETLHGVPGTADGSGSGPRFVPPPLDARENSGIISLASPIHQPSARGRIELDEEDWQHPGSELASESAQRRIDAVLDGISGGNAEAQDLGGFGEPGLMRLAARFPGPLEILRRDLRALPPPSAHGPFVRTAIRLGEAIVPFLLDLFDHPDPDVRFYAAFVFQELRDSRCMRALSELAFDPSGDVRVVAMRVLETYSRAEAFADAVHAVREQLDSANRTRQLYAARAVGTLRDIEAIPKLIDLLASKDRFIQEAALESLCSITGQQHGLKPHRWKTWFGDHGAKHRVEWIIGSLRHRDLPVRRWAADELVRITGHRVPFSPQGDKKARDVAAKTWTQWWESTGRARFSTPHQSDQHAG